MFLFNMKREFSFILKLFAKGKLEVFFILMRFSYKIKYA